MAAPLRPERLGPVKREAIVAAACELFSQRSYDGTPVPLIAARAGVGAGTLYRYFPGKQALRNAVYRECKLAMGRTVDAETPVGAPPRAEFEGLWRGLRRFAAEQPAAFRFLELHHHAGSLDAESRAVSDALFDRIADFVRRGQVAGALRAGQPAVLIALAFGAFVGLVKEACDERFALDDAVFDASVEAVWSLLSARP